MQASTKFKWHALQWT